MIFIIIVLSNSTIIQLLPRSIVETLVKKVSTKDSSFRQYTCDSSCGTFLWDGLGRWVNGRWKPYIKGTLSWNIKLKILILLTVCPFSFLLILSDCNICDITEEVVSLTWWFPRQLTANGGGGGIIRYYRALGESGKFFRDTTSPPQAMAGPLVDL